MPPHSAAERHMHTLEVLKNHGHASVTKLSEQLEVSEVTIRKDLGVLEDRNLLVRTHGGAVLADHFLYDLPFDEKSRHRAQEKARIGRCAADLVKDGCNVILNAGSTTVQVARHINGKRNVTVATNALFVALELMNNLTIDVLMLGGLLHPATGALVGPEAESMLQQHSFDYAFLAGDGFDFEHGFTTTNILEADLSRTMMRAANRTVAVLDSTKFGRKGLTQVCPPRYVDTIITDDEISEKSRSHLQVLGIEVITA